MTDSYDCLQALHFQKFPQRFFPEFEAILGRVPHRGEYIFPVEWLNAAMTINVSKKVSSPWSVVSSTRNTRGSNLGARRVGGFGVPASAGGASVSGSALKVSKVVRSACAPPPEGGTPNPSVVVARRFTPYSAFTWAGERQAGGLGSSRKAANNVVPHFTTKYHAFEQFQKFNQMGLDNT